MIWHRRKECVQEIILCFREGHSIRTLVRTFHISPDTIRQILRAPYARLKSLDVLTGLEDFR
jgi:lambda repressor-like predicted transcriptional regulator